MEQATTQEGRGKQQCRRDGASNNMVERATTTWLQGKQQWGKQQHRIRAGRASNDTGGNSNNVLEVLRGGVRGISSSDERHFRFRFSGQRAERRTQLARTGEPPSLRITGHGSRDHRERPTHSLTLNRACHRCPSTVTASRGGQRPPSPLLSADPRGSGPIAGAACRGA
ncbi:hypothetical protein NDU88_006893 [Pleurodeles waltl]|uniref:Uncharacterized protein n=1 Tax=Pleurodeles waltl TaxID=8319 RepID=A0AAV7QK50_PLEWA|nr:hypothetical protein NDU88_006893 [Pleurodeles waltl]